MKQVLMILADGFEEIEAVGTADVLRRSGLDVTLAGLAGLSVTGSHHIRIIADKILAEVKPENFDAIVLPGGMPGSNNLRESEAVLSAVRTVYNKGGVVAAICAAPIVLARAGVINGKNITAYPGFEENFTAAKYTGEMTVVDGQIITGKGPGATIEFAAKVATALGCSEQVSKVLAGMFVR